MAATKKRKPTIRKTTKAQASFKVMRDGVAVASKARKFNCPDDCKSLTVILSAGAVPTALVIAI